MYAGNFMYRGGSFDFYFHPEGYVSKENSNYKYYYQYKDHLGNIRVSYDNSGSVSSPNASIVEEHNYYPFGLQHRGYNNVINGTENNYQTYQGKEEEKELGKNTYAFGWRDYDAAIGRFNKVDRFAEKYYSKSPYGFSANNPIRLIEVQGDSLWISFGKSNENKVLYQDGNLLNSDGTAYTGDGVKIKKDGSVKIKNSFLKKTVKALNAIGGTDTGGDMLADLQGSDFNFTVNDAKFNPKDAGHNMFLADNTVNAHFWEGMATGQGYFTDIGSGGNIYWNASDPAYGTLTEVGGNRRFRPTTNLAHELVHGWDANTGNLDGRPGTPGGLSRKEYRASYYENQIRGQLGTPLRSIYRYQGNNYNLLNNNQPIFYSKPSIELMIAN